MRINNLGFMLLEIIIATTVIATVFVLLLGIGFSVLNVSSSAQKENQANSLMIGELEALRSFRDGTQWATNGLGTLFTGPSNPYHLVNNSNVWTIVSGVETIGIFTKRIVFDRVSRDQATFDIEDSYNVSRDDADTRKITITVSWPGKTMQAISYLTNWK